MRNTMFLLLLFTLTSLNLEAQYPSGVTSPKLEEEVSQFMGIPPSGFLNDVIKKFISKGFKLKSFNQDSTYTLLRGYLSDEQIELAILSSIYSKTVWKFVVMLPVRNSWTSIKSEYEKYKGVISNKYGNPNENFEYFRTPYYEGDGHEESAVKLEKVVMSTYWKSVCVEISQFMQVWISYENKKNIPIVEKEEQKRNNQIF